MIAREEKITLRRAIRVAWCRARFLREGEFHAKSRLLMCSIRIHWKSIAPDRGADLGTAGWILPAPLWPDTAPEPVHGIGKNRPPICVPHA